MDTKLAAKKAALKKIRAMLGESEILKLKGLREKKAKAAEPKVEVEEKSDEQKN